MAEQRLTLKQERFVNAYLGAARGNAREAARVAGYARPEDQAWDVLNAPAVRARIDARLAAETLSSAEVLAELTTIARAEWRDVIQVRVDHRGNTIDAKIVLADKVRALELLGRYYRLFTDRTELTGADGGPVRMVDLTRLSDDDLAVLERLGEKVSWAGGVV